MLASADTCFLIDWARYRGKWLLGSLFDRVLVSEHVLVEVESGYTLDFIAEAMRQGLLYLVPVTSREERLVRELVEISLRDPRVPAIHEAEAYAVAIAVSYDAVVLTENKAVLWLKTYYPDVIPVPIWRSIDLLVEAALRGVIRVESRNNFLGVLDDYTRDTHHVFSRVDVERALRRLGL